MANDVDVRARTRPGTTLTDVFAALFPCGSVTGAPKVRAMQMIHALEPAPRGVYCGAVGVVRPGVRGGVHATFNVPIRTVVLQGNQACCGIGSGITADAVADAEWNEWRHKRAFVERASMPFDLLETLALEEGRLRHVADHLARLQRAAAHFSIPWNAGAVHQCLQALADGHPQGLWRVRLLLGAAGQPRAEAFALQPTPEPVRLQLAGGPLMEAHSEFVRFKTTRRAHYAAFAPTETGVFDTVLWNAAGEITESTFGNIAMLLDGRWVTPPLACGLLPGVGRAVALRDGRVIEAVVRIQICRACRAGPSSTACAAGWRTWGHATACTPPAPAVLVQWSAIGMDRCEPTEDGSMPLFQGIVFLILGLGLLGEAYQSLARGWLPFGSNGFKGRLEWRRDEQPGLFWLAWALNATAGLVMAVFALGLLLGVSTPLPLR